MSSIPINSGTGPGVAVDLIGTDNYQVVKIMQAASGATAALSATLAVSGTMSVAAITTGTVNVVNVLSASGVTIAAITTGTVNVINTVAISGTNTALQGGTWNVATLTTLLGVVSVSGGGGGVQYSQGATTVAATGTGTIVFGIQATTAFAIGITGSNQQLVSVANTVTVTGTVGALMLQSLDNTNDSVSIYGVQTGSAAKVQLLVSTSGGLYIASGGGGGAQYGIADTSMGATGTGTIILGMQSGATTGRALALTTTGGIFTVQTVATITTLLGTVAVSGGGGGVQYSVGDTSMAATGTGTIAIGMQSGATTGRALAITTSGQQLVQVSTGTMNVINVLSASGITVASITTGTMNVINVLSASNVTIASITTGTMNVINVVAISGTVTAPFITTTASLAIIGTAHASRFQAYALATTSAGAGVIIKTSGASTLYVTDVLVSVPSPMTVGLYSETTGPLAQVFLAANGGWAQQFVQPLICTTAQSLRVILSSSGSCSVMVVGYTVT